MPLRTQPRSSNSPRGAFVESMASSKLVICGALRARSLARLNYAEPRDDKVVGNVLTTCRAVVPQVRAAFCFGANLGTAIATSSRSRNRSGNRSRGFDGTAEAVPFLILPLSGSCTGEDARATSHLVFS